MIVSKLIYPHCAIVNNKSSGTSRNQEENQGNMLIMNSLIDIIAMAMSCVL